MLTFAQPFFLLVGAAAILFVVLRATVRSSAAFRLRLAAVTLAACALAGPQWPLSSPGTDLLVLLDRSHSMGDAAARAQSALLADAARYARAGDRLGIVTFAGTAQLVHPLAPPADAAALPLPAQAQPRETDIAAALRLAQAHLRPGRARRIVLVSDGRATRGDAAAEARTLASAGTPLDVLALPPAAAADEVALESLTVPARAVPGEALRAQALVRSTVAQRARVRLLVNGHRAAELDADLRAGAQTVTVPFTAPAAGLVMAEAEIEAPRDSSAANNRAGAALLAEGAAPVLLAGPESESAALAGILAREGIPVERAAAPRGTAAQFARYAAVFLTSLPAREAAAQDLSALVQAASQAGTGLAMTGGPGSFAPGGWRGSVVERALPVRSELPDEARLASVALVLLIDRSGSMAEAAAAGMPTKLALALDAAGEAAAALAPRDSIGIIAFDSSAQWVVPLAPRPSEAELARALSAVTPGGGTDAFPAFRLAIPALAAADAQVRHIIFLTDGLVTGADYDAILRQLNALRITVTGVGIGDDADGGFVERIARLSGGRAYLAADPESVPRIFLQETAIAQRAYIVEEPFTPRVAGAADVLRGLAGFPRLGGYIATAPAPGASVPLVTGEGDPLVALGRHGLARTAAWTSDLTARWAGEWLAWEGNARFWIQLVRALERPAPGALLDAELVTEGREWRLVVSARDAQGRPLSALRPEARLLGVQDEGPIRLRLTGAGRYESRGTAIASTLIATVEDERGALAVAGAAAAEPSEPRDGVVDEPALAALAAATGGRVAPDVRAWWDRPAVAARESRDITHWFLVAALACFLADLTARRVHLIREAAAAAWMRLRPAPLSVPADTRLEALKARRSEVVARRADSGPPAPAQPPASPAPPAAPAPGMTRASEPRSADAPAEGTLASRLRSARKPPKE